MHLACYQKLQSGLVGGLRRQLRQVRDESDDDIASTLWTSKYNLCRSQCRCRCGAGFFKPQVTASGEVAGHARRTARDVVGEQREDVASLGLRKHGWWLAF